MPRLKLTVLSLRYSSWSMRPWLALTHAGAAFETETVEVDGLASPGQGKSPPVATPISGDLLARRRAKGSVRGLFPVLLVDGAPVHESLAICDYVADAYPDAMLWPDDVVERARARAISCEMLSGFASLRTELSCHLFGRVPRFSPSAAAEADIARIREIWSGCLDRSGGPFLFGRFSNADAMYYPVLTRFRTYNVRLDEGLAGYAQALEDLSAVRALLETARQAPRIDVYDAYLRKFGGDPDAALR